MFLERLKQLKNNISQVQQSLDQIVLDSVKDHEKSIIDLNREKQLYDSGISSTSASLGSYAQSTMKVKQRKGQPTDRVTLKDKGDLYKSFFIEYGTDEFSISATDHASVYMVKKYGKEIYGLTDENVQDAIAITRDDIANRIRLILDGTA